MVILERRVWIMCLNQAKVQRVLTCLDELTLRWGQISDQRGDLHSPALCPIAIRKEPKTGAADKDAGTTERVDYRASKGSLE